MADMLDAKAGQRRTPPRPQRHFRKPDLAAAWATTALIGALLYARPGTAGSTNACGCKVSTLAGQSQLDPSSGAYVGAGILTLGEKPHEVTWQSVILSFVANPDGSLSLSGSHRITSTSSKIDFTTSDLVVALPTDQAGTYRFSSRLTVEEGRGRIQGGALAVTGVVNLIEGSVRLTDSSGRLCPKSDR